MTVCSRNAAPPTPHVGNRAADTSQPLPRQKHPCASLHMQTQLCAARFDICELSLPLFFFSTDSILTKECVKPLSQAGTMRATLPIRHISR